MSIRPMIADLNCLNCLNANTVTNTAKSFTYKMAYRYGTQLRHCHPIIGVGYT